MGDLVTSFERLGPVERSNGRIAVLARRPAKYREDFCDFVASMGREGPPSILAPGASLDALCSAREHRYRELRGARGPRRGACGNIFKTAARALRGCDGLQ